MLFGSVPVNVWQIVLLQSSFKNGSPLQTPPAMHCLCIVLIPPPQTFEHFVHVPKYSHCPCETFFKFSKFVSISSLHFLHYIIFLPFFFPCKHANQHNLKSLLELLCHKVYYKETNYQERNNLLG